MSMNSRHAAALVGLVFDGAASSGDVAGLAQNRGEKQSGLRNL